MDLQEIKNDFKSTHISKNVIIVCLSVALVIVSTAAICMATFRGRHHGGRYENNRYEGMMQRGGNSYGPGMMMRRQAVPMGGGVNTQVAPPTPVEPGIPKTQ